MSLTPKEEVNNLLHKCFLSALKNYKFDMLVNSSDNSFIDVQITILQNSDEPLFCSLDLSKLYTLREKLVMKSYKFFPWSVSCNDAKEMCINFSVRKKS